MIGRRRTMAFLVALGLIGLALPLAAQEFETTIYLVRHAEKQKGSDPSLSPTGVQRAETLIRVLADSGVSTIYSTQFARTRETAEPLAGKLGIEVTVDPVAGDLPTYARTVADRLVKEHVGGVVLVVGHSNTLPALIEALGIDDPPKLTEEDYDDLFAVTVGKDGVARLTHLHYGAASP